MRNPALLAAYTAIALCRPGPAFAADAAAVAKIHGGIVDCVACDLRGANLMNTCVKEHDLHDADFDGAHTAAVAPPLTAALYGLEVLAHAIEDHQGNETRFLLVTRDGVPEPTGRDRTTIACFQRSIPNARVCSTK